MSDAGEIPDRYWAKVSKDSPDGCWLWTEAKASGYGRVYWYGRVRAAHHITYESLIGPIPEGLDLDHLCRNRACINPEHLEPVTRQVNLLRGHTIPAGMVAHTHCSNGHEFTPENTYMWHNARHCKTCRANMSRGRDRSKYRIGEVATDCIMCGTAFSYVRTTGGRAPNTCSDNCTKDRKRKAAREHQRRKRASQLT